jgi:F0F1-type ATP synthase gamma subunit
VVERALASLPEPPLPPTDGRAVLLLAAMSEQPLCGAFNHNVLELVQRRWRELRDRGEVRLAVIGQRGKRLLAAHGLLPDETESAATSLHGLRDLVNRLAARIGPRYAAGEFGAVHVLYCRYHSVSE